MHAKTDGGARISGLVTATVLLLLAAPLAQAGSDEITGTLLTDGTVETTGTAATACPSPCRDATIHMPSLHTRSESALWAEEITLSTDWRRGLDASSDQRSTSRIATGEGSTEATWTNTTVTFDPFQPNAPLLTLPLHTSLSVQAGATGHPQATVVHNETIVAVGQSPETAEAGEFETLGFWYTITEPAVAQTRLDTATITGNFTLFVHNVTIHITQSHEGTYQNWTGYKEWNPTTPAGAIENPAIKEFEHRITTVNVTNGTLHLDAPGSVALYTPTMETHVEGTVKIAQAAGQLYTDALLYQYTQAPAQLTGTGVLNLAPQNHTPRTTTPIDPDATPPLRLDATGDFKIDKTPGLETTALPTTSMGPLSSLPLWLLALAVILPLAAVAVRAATNNRWRWLPTTRKPMTRDQEQAGGHGAAQDDLEDMVRAYERVREREGDACEPETSLGLIRAAHHAGNTQRAAQELALLSLDYPVETVDLLQDPAFTELGWLALQSLSPDAHDLWIETEWNRDRRANAQHLFTHLLQRDENLSDRYIVDTHFDALVRMTIEELDPPTLSTLIELAWHADRLTLARDALLHLATTAPDHARTLITQPRLETLADDPRIEPLLTRDDTDPPN